MAPRTFPGHRAPASPRRPPGSPGLDDIPSFPAGGIARRPPDADAGWRGCGKTLLAMTFLSWRRSISIERACSSAFEESPERAGGDVASLGYDLPDMIRAQKLAMDHIRSSRSEIRGDRRIRPRGLVRTTGISARRDSAPRGSVLDTIEALFSGSVRYRCAASGATPAVSAGSRNAASPPFVTAENAGGDLSRVNGASRELRSPTCVNSVGPSASRPDLDATFCASSSIRGSRTARTITRFL